MKRIFFLVIFSMSAFSVFSQKTDKQNIEFSYVRLPFKPINKSIKNYTSEVILQYEADILAKKNKAEEDYQKAKQASSHAAHRYFGNLIPESSIKQAMI